MPTPAMKDSKQLNDWLFNSANSAEFAQMIEHTTRRLQKQIEHCDQPFKPTTVQALLKKIKSVNLQKPLNNLDDAFNELQTLYLDNAVYFHHEKYIAHLNCPVTNISILSDLIAASINTSVDTWDQSAGATLIEQHMIDWSAKQCGFDQQADGVFTSGGTQSNLLAVLLARDHFSEKRLNGHNTKTQGLPICASRFVIFCSELSHFSIEKSAALCGLGYQSVIKVATDHNYKMSPEALKIAISQAKREGKMPIAVIATAGTTDFGSIDPIQPISAIAQQHKLWLHVDAAYGCGLLASNTRKHLLDGLHQADSVTLDFHKSFFQPVSCSAFLIKDQQHFKHITYHADYLNPLSQTDAGTPNLVNKSLQTTRRFDALKLWMTLRVIGKDAIGEAFDAVCHKAKQAERLIAQQPNFDVLPTGDLSTVVFRYRPTHNVISEDALDDCNYQTRQIIASQGKSMIAATKYQGRQYLKMTFLNPNTDITHVASVCQEIKQTANAYLQNNSLLETVA